MKTCIKKLLTILYYSLSFVLFACGVNSGGSAPTNTNATSIAQALTIDNISTIPVFPNNSTTSVVYVHNNSSQPISNIKYTIIYDDSIDQVTNSFTIDATDCETISANSRCAIAFTTPVLSGTNTQGSVVLVATYGANSFSQLINYGQILDNSTAGVSVNSDVSVSKSGNSVGYAILYAYAGNGQNYLLQKLSTSNIQVNLVDNLSNQMLSNNTILPIEVSSSSSVDSQTSLKISYTSVSGSSLTTNVGITAVASPSGPILVSGLAPVINTKVTTIGSFPIINAGNQPANLGTITYQPGISAATGTGACGTSLPSYSSCKIYFTVTESGGSGNINISYNGGSLAQTVAWYNGNGKGMVMGMSSSQNMIGFVAGSSESKSILVTVKNLGAYSLGNIIPSATLLNGSATANIADNTCNSITLAIGSTCTYKVNMRDAVAESNRQISFNIKGTYNNGESYSRVLVSNYNVISPRVLAVGDSGALTTITLESQFIVTQRKTGGNNLWEVTYSGTQFITVGDSSAVFTSPDAMTWTSSNTGITNNTGLYGIASNGALIVAVGQNGRIFSSPTGSSWTPRSSTGSNNNLTLYEINYLGGKFVAVGDNGTIVTSSNGTTWTSSTSAITNTLRGIAYNGTNLYVASGLGGGIETSPNGTTWTPVTNVTSDDLLGSTYGNGKFVLVGEAGRILTSTDGTTWTARTSGTTQNLNQVSYNSNGAQFMAVGANGTVLTSPDAITWTVRNSGSTSSFDGVTNNASVFVFVGSGGQIYTSNIIKNAQSTTIGSSKNLYGITFGTQVFAVGESGTILASTNGVDWSSITSGTTNTLRGINYSGALLITVGDNGTILSSNNGAIWTPSNSGTTNALYGIAYGNGLYVTVGAGGKILTSPDGITWTSRTSGITNILYSVTYSNGKFVVVGAGGTILTSSDGISWATTSSSGITTNLRSVTYGNQNFIAVGDGGKVLTSPDGITWTSRTSGVINDLLGVSHGTGYSFAVGQSGIIVYSIDDGVTWVSQGGTTSNLNAVIVLL